MTTDKQARKERPVARGVLDYFPDAIAEVANVSYVGNQQHNPGEEMHWARGKSDDHADCIARHLIERGTIDNDGLRHSAKAAWRALAMLQIEIEQGKKPETCLKDYVERVDRETVNSEPENFLQPLVPQKFFDRPERERDFRELIRLGCPDQVAKLIVMGTTYSSQSHPGFAPQPYAYVAGPMRGLPGFNFPAFDAARDQLVKLGYNVISPADIDRAAGFKQPLPLTLIPQPEDQTVYAFRDFWALYFLAKTNQGNDNCRDTTGRNAIVMLRNYERSTGATAELGLAKWLGLKVREIGEFAIAPESRESQEPVIYKRIYRNQTLNPSTLVYRLVGDVVEYRHPDEDWCPSTDYPTVQSFHAAIVRGELCALSSSAISTNPSATQATSASVRTCATSTSATR